MAFKKAMGNRAPRHENTWQTWRKARAWGGGQSAQTRTAAGRRPARHVRTRTCPPPTGMGAQARHTAMRQCAIHGQMATNACLAQKVPHGGARRVVCARCILLHHTVPPTNAGCGSGPWRALPSAGRPVCTPGGRVRLLGHDGCAPWSSWVPGPAPEMGPSTSVQVRHVLPNTCRWAHFR